MTKYIVYATWCECIASLHIVAESEEKALEAFKKRFGDRVGPAWNLDIWEVDSKPYFQKAWRGDGVSRWSGLYDYDWAFRRLPEAWDG